MKTLLQQELKKIWSPMAVALLILSSIMYYFVFAKIFVDMIDTGTDGSAQYELALEWSHKYGNTLDESECDEIRSELASDKAAFDQQIKDIPMAATYGITSYDEFSLFESSYLASLEDGSAKVDTEKEELINEISNHTNLTRITAIKETIDEYEIVSDKSLTSCVDGEEMSDKERARLSQLDSSDIKFGYIPDALLNATTGLIIALVIWISVSILILLSPTIVRDKLNRVQDIQFCSRVGRRVYGVQVRAAIISGTILTVLNCMALAGILISKGILAFRDFYIFSTDYIPWVDWTYGRYLLVVMLISLGLGICVTMLTVFLSGKSKGYIGMIMKAALLMIVLMNFFGMLPLVTRPFYMFNPMGFQLHAKGGELMTLAILFGISLILTVTSLIKNRKAPAA